MVRANPSIAIQGIPAHLATQGPPQGSAQSPVAGARAQPPATPAPAAGAGTTQPAAPAQQPRNLFQAAAQAAQTPAAGTPTPAGRGAAGAGAGGDGNELDALRNNPLVGELRQLVQQNPALLQPFLQQLAATNPQLFELINRNSQQFMEYLTEGSNVDLGALGDDDMEGDEGAGAGGNVVQVSAAERDAIQRLEAMGFDRQMVLQAFIACDRNEELACVILA